MLIFVIVQSFTIGLIVAKLVLLYEHLCEDLLSNVGKNVLEDDVENQMCNSATFWADKNLM